MISEVNNWVGLVISLLGVGGLFFAWHRDKISKEKEYEHGQKNNENAHAHFQREIEDMKTTEVANTARVHVRLDQKEAKEHSNEILLNRIDERIQNLQETIKRMADGEELK